MLSCEIRGSEGNTGVLPSRPEAMDIDSNLVHNQRRMMVEPVAQETWTMGEMLAAQMLAFISQAPDLNQHYRAPDRYDWHDDNFGPVYDHPPPQVQERRDVAGLSSRRYWSESEHLKFLDGIVKFGLKNVRDIAQAVGTRNATQVRTHLQKYMLRRDEWDRRFQPRPEIVQDLDRILLELQSMNEAAKRQKDAQAEMVMGRAAPTGLTNGATGNATVYHM